MKTSFRSAKTAVIAALLQNDQLSRLELSERAEVSPAAITEVTQTLLREGLLLEQPSLSAERRRGRPTVQLSLQASHSCFAGISISEEETLLAITNLRGELLYTDAVPEFASPDEMPAAARAAFSKALQKSGIARSRVRGVGIAVPGIVDVEEGVCRYSAGLNWRDVPVAQLVSKALRIQAWVDNDANAVAMGEKTFGLAREYDNFSSIVLGRTIGSAHYMHGILYRGEDGSAGEIGHITMDPAGKPCRCGRNGCLDTISGAHALEQDARDAGLKIRKASDLEALARQGNSKAVHLLRTAGQVLGNAVAILVHLNNPRAVLFTDLEGFGNGVFRTATRQAIENSVLPRFLGSTHIAFGDGEHSSLARSAASIAAFNYLMSL